MDTKLILLPEIWNIIWKFECWLNWSARIFFMSAIIIGTSLVGSFIKSYPKWDRYYYNPLFGFSRTYGICTSEQMTRIMTEINPDLKRFLPRAKHMETSNIEPEYLCSEGHELKVLDVKKDGDNKGRKFLAGNECGAFIFLDLYHGNPPKCQPKKEWKQTSKTTPAKTASPPPSKKKWPESPHSQHSALMKHTNLEDLARDKGKELMDLSDQFETDVDKIAWYFKIANHMNEYFLSKLNK